MHITIQTFGWLASILTILMYTPQVIKVLKLKQAQGISKLTFTLVTAGTLVWVIAGPLVPSWQAWTANVIISLMMIPIIFYVFKENKKIFWTIVALIVASIALSLVFWILSYTKGITMNFGVNVFFVTLAGLCLSSALVPQVIKLIKDKSVGHFSLLMTVLVVIGNALWSTYWGLQVFTTNETQALVIFSISFATSLFPMLVPILILVIHYKYNRKNV